MKRIKSILIVGASGFIGTHLCLALRKKYKVFATYCRHPFQIEGVTSIPLNPLNRDWAKRVVYSVQPNVVIYSCGRNSVPWAEENTKEAEALHADGAVNLATVSNIFQPKYILISNSYVFDGRKGNYYESDIVLPPNALGKAKLNSENYIKGRSLNYVIVRSVPLYGRGNGYNLSFLDRIRFALDRGDRIEMSNEELHSYAPIYGFRQLIEKLVEGGPRNKVIHYSGLTKMTEYEFCRSFAKRFGFNGDLIFPRTDPQLKVQDLNPQYDFSLNCTEAVKTLKIKPFTLEEGFDLLEQELVALP